MTMYTSKQKNENKSFIQAIYKDLLLTDYMNYISGHWLIYWESLRVKQRSLSLLLLNLDTESVSCVAAAGQLNHIV